MNIKDALEQIKKVVFSANPAPEQPAAFSEYTLKDGTVISVSELAIGGTVMIGDAPAPAGTHELADGGVIVVGEGGVIAEVKPAEDMGNEQKPQDYSEQFAAIEGRFAQQDEVIRKQGEMLQAFDAALKQSGETMKQLLEVVEQLANAPTADPAEAPKQSFQKAQPGSRLDKFKAIAELVKTSPTN